MQRKLLPEADKYTKQNRRRHVWQRIVSGLACIVVFCTTYALILPAITMETERTVYCGLEEHTHFDSCYTQITSEPVTKLACSWEVHTHDEDECYDEEDNLICDLADFVVHTHDDACYDENGEVICPLEELEEHTHTEDCYVIREIEAHTHGDECYKLQQGEQTCELEESEEHSHADACYAWETVLACKKQEVETAYTEKELICEKPEIQLHTHTEEDGCYETVTDEEGNEQLVLVCDQQEVFEHIHDETCFVTEDIPVDTETLTCTLSETEGHEHTARCYGTWAMICGYDTEHTHTLACYSDPTADLETEETWTASLPASTTGIWSTDLLAAAKSQLGYTESELNYIVEADGETTSGYSRYGAWYASVSGIDAYAYAPWNVTFLFFDLYHCGISFMDFPYEEDCVSWIDSLAYYDLYRTADSYAPIPGDLVFVDTDGDGEADCAGVVTGTGDGLLTAILGDHNGTVAELSYTLPTLTAQTGETQSAETQQTEAAETTAETEALDFTTGGAGVMLLSDGTEETDSETTEAPESTQPTDAAEATALIEFQPDAQIVGYADMTQAQEDVDPGSTSAVNLASWNTGDKLYLDLSSFTGWADAGAEFALFYRDSNANTHMTLMSKVTGTDYLYYIAIPSNMQVTYNFRIVRKNPSVAIDGSCWWNATDELTLPTNGNNCYKINAWGTVAAGTNNGYWSTYDDGSGDDGSDDESDSVDTLPEVKDGYRRVFYDATLSKLSYTGDSGMKGDYGIPKSGKTLIYCWADKLYTMTHLTSYTKDGHTWTDVYYVDIPQSCTTITFASFKLISATDYGWSGESTTNLSIPSTCTDPCFYADSSDDSIYNSSSGNQRGGYWAEAFTIRNAETGKGGNTDVVDITSATITANSSKMYLNATFYDYYTDYELNGYNRDNYDTSATKTTDRIYQPFRQFNQALSDYYSGVSASHPIYWGNFQNYDGDHFGEIADTLNLFGYSGSENKFFAENNSMWGFDGKEITDNSKDGAQATMGLVSSSLSSGNLMITTSSGSVAAPFFSKSFLQGNNSKNTVLGEVYENVSFPFSKEALGSSSLGDEDGSGHGTVDYWVFDSRDTTLRMKYDSTSGYWLDDTTGTSDVYGSTPDKDSTTDMNFFPFNSSSQSAKSQRLNYGFATKLEFTFRLTENGTVKSTTGEEVPIEFNFSGDDDVWVFIDGKLALDVGGGHGRVSGYLNFKNKEYYVSRVKNSGGGVTYNETGEFTINGSNTDEHTLTMFYMERGLWESNMMITFNFPDENLLEVEKVVDDYDVNQELFGGLFDNKSMFTFNIKNLATHYGAVPLSTETVDPVTLDTTIESGKVSLTAYGTNIFDRWRLSAFDSDHSVVHWYAHEKDSTSDYREKRYGNLWLNTATGSPNIVDLSKMAYMEFEVYFEGATPSLSKMYIQLKDTKGNVLTKADSQKLYLSSCVYGTVSPVANNWFKIRLSLSSMLASSLTEETILQYIRFGYNEPVNIYLRGFKFLPAVSASESNVGFVKQQYTIPDYGSAETGVLQPAAGAVYTSSITSLARATANAVDADGNFVLSAGETASFYNQFRRGSYISLTENVSGDLFDTSWTIYEGGKAVTKMGTGTTVTNSTSTVIVNNVPGTAVDDGRTENKLEGSTDGHTIENAYNGKKPNANTFVFRSFSDPDNTVSATKLKVVFTNKVKTGSLTIYKQQAGSEDLSGTFTFYVVFTNVGGMSLESDPITVGPFDLSVGYYKEIKGIPLNTEYAIYEIKPDNEEITLDHVEVGKTHDEEDKTEVTYTVTTYKDVGSAYMTTGTVTKNDSNNSHTVEYYNIKKPVVSLTLTKQWVDVENDEDLPRSIRVQLQYSTDEGKTWSAIDGYYNDRTIGPGYALWSTYTYTFADLDKYLYNDNNESVATYQYRVVELDSNGVPIAEGGLLDNAFTVNYGVVAQKSTDAENEYTQIITNTEVPKTYELPETGGVGTHHYTFCGLLLMAAPLVYGCMNRRKRERRAAR